MLAGIRHDLGDDQAAEQLARDGLELIRQTADAFSEAEILNQLGAILLAQHRPDDAVARHTEALDIATAIDSGKQQVEALIRLAAPPDQRDCATPGRLGPSRWPTGWATGDCRRPRAPCGTRRRDRPAAGRGR
ncbi:tetratricopeptide repeat protein [Dactylosporangium sp. NPDC049140]|uniref:tetratricopeptide repeat protein n=1 Tax=Dactylosporangium sp. NPDC049140 TaxID=3155647 RepID=UPI0033C5FA59